MLNKQFNKDVGTLSQKLDLQGNIFLIEGKDRLSGLKVRESACWFGTENAARSQGFLIPFDFLF